MKWIAVNILVLLLLISGCNSSTQKDWETNVPGVYVTEYENQFSIGYDTLTVEYEKGTERYSIHRSVSYRPVRNGKERPKAYKKSLWQGVADPTTPAISIIDNGRKLLFNPVKLQLQTGSVIYHKLK